MKQIEASPPLPSSDETKAHWQKPTVTRLVARQAEGGDSFAGDAGNLS